jgi:hypothetical protein
VVDDFRHDRWQLVILIFRGPSFDNQIATFDPTQLAKAAPERMNVPLVGQRLRIDESDPHDSIPRLRALSDS